jgi:transposase
MRRPLFIRPLTPDQQRRLEEGLRSSDAFVLRRCQILLASARAKTAPKIAADLGCDDETVRDAIRAFNRNGLNALQAGSKRPHHIRAAFGATQAEQLRARLHQSPRIFGKDTRLWTRELAAEVAFEPGLTPQRVSGEAIRLTVARLGVKWQRAKHWITSPDPAYPRKKNARDRLIRWARQHSDWVLGFQDETWWSRLTHPALHSWSDANQPLRLLEPTASKTDPDRKALACYGLLLRARDHGTAQDEMWLRFVEKRPISAITLQFLEWCCAKVQHPGKRALLLVWDNASWHISQRVKTWIREHNRQVKQTGQGVRLVVCGLPTKGPWLNPIEPKWVHGKRRIVEPERMLTADELMTRVYATFHCLPEPSMSIPDNVPC